MSKLVVGDWASLTVMVSVDPAGHWEVDLRQAERYVSIRTTLPLASGSGHQWTRGESMESMCDTIAEFVSQMVHRVIEPM